MSRAREIADRDLAATELILDADNDTSITADTDDQIDIRVAGSDQIKIATSEVAFNEASGDIDFRVESNGNANMLFIDGGNDVIGIKTATPTNYYADDLVVTAPDEGGMTIVSGTAERTYLAFADGTSGDARYRGFLNYDHNTDTLGLGSSGGTSVEVDTNKNVTLTTGNLVIGTAGKGIDFSVNTASSVTGTSNQDELLDHYEEGYFTPTIYGSSGSAGSQQINGQEGRYVKIGKLVYITLYFYLQNGGAGSWTGTNRFGGLPFTNGISNRQALSIGADGLNHDEITFTVSGSSNFGHIVDMYTGASVNYSSFVTGYSIQISGCYYTT